MDDESDMVTLMIEDVALKCKKQELIANSNYFKVMFEGNFAERDKSIITLNEIDVKSMELIFNILWDQNTGPSQLTDDELLLVLQTSCMLQFEDIREKCINILTEKLQPDNCIKIWIVCESHGITPLYLKAKNLALIEFDVIRNLNVLQDFDLPQLHSYLANVMLQSHSELDVFTVCMQWYYENGCGDAATLLKFLSCVDFNSAHDEEISEMMLMPDINSNQLLMRVFNLICDIKRGETHYVEKEDPFLVTIAQSAVNSTKRNKSFVDPVIFVRKFLDLEKYDDDDGVEVCYDAYKRKRKYMRIGGIENSKSTLFIYDMFKEKYVKCIDIPEEKYVGCEGFHIVGYKEQIFLFGGEITLGSGHWNLNFWVFDTIRDRWERKTRLPAGRRHFYSCICGPYLYIIGGTGSFRIIQDNMFSYNYKDNIWSTQFHLPCSAVQLRCCSFNDQLLLINMSQRCAYIFTNTFIKLTFEDDAQLVTAYPLHFSLFTYKNRIYVKSSTLIEFELCGDKLCVRNVWPTPWNLVAQSDQMESIVCNDNVLTLYKCPQMKMAHLEVMSLREMATLEVRLLPSDVDDYSIDLATKLFALQHHYRMVETDVYVNQLTNISDDNLRSVTEGCDV